MTVELGTPRVDELGAAVGALREWQADGAPMQLHPGDLGWCWRFGADATATMIRTWRRAGRVLAVGFLDGAALVRLTTDPDVRRDEELGRQLAADLTRDERGVLPAGPAAVEAPRDALLQDLLAAAGWTTGEPWTPLRRDLAEPVPAGDPDRGGLRIETVGPERAAEWSAVHRASFDGSRLTDAGWHAMATGLPYADARCLLGYDSGGTAVAAVTVWSAGPGRPGLLEPMGVHRDHRRRGHGRAINLAAAAALRELGSSSALVCTPSANAGAVIAYEAAGFERLAEVRDRVRAA